jgi:hypothetical protein
VLNLWRNPEFVRHVRAELRPARAVMVAMVVLFLSGLIGLACWSERRAMLEAAERGAREFDERWTPYLDKMRQDFPRQVWLLAYKWLMGLQAGILTLWSLLACAQSVSGERDRKTWDFQRTTSLTPGELLVGKLYGEPILAYFGTLCVLPFCIWAGVAGGFGLAGVLSVYVTVFAAAAFLGLCGLWLSTLLETRSRGIGMIGALALYGFTIGMYAMTEPRFPGLAALSPLIGLRQIFGLNFSGRGDISATLFGHAIPWLLMSLLLYGLFGAWLMLMLVRNLKRDYSEIRPLSRWQAIGCAASLNFMFYALLNTSGATEVKSSEVATFMVGLNVGILFAIGLATLAPPERLRVWWRSRAAGSGNLFSEDGLPWPWLALSALVSYLLLVWGLLAWKPSLDFSSSSLLTAALQMLVALIFITRDILFLQWCTLTRLRPPVVKGFLFLCLYYLAAAVTVGISAVSGENSTIAALNLLTPVGVFDPRSGWDHSTSLYTGIALQAGLIAIILVAITNRLGRPSLVAAVSEG